MIDYYDYDTSLRREDTNAGGTATKVRKSNYAKTTTKRKPINDDYLGVQTRKKVDWPDYTETRNNRNLEDISDENIDTRKMARQAKLEQSRKNAKHIAAISVGFIILFTISYRYALINSKFNEKENLKDELSQIKKENAQVQVSIEQGMNVKNIEKEAQERLGMQKLDANNKIYVSLPKKDYIESASKKIKEEKNENWFTKLIDIFKGN